MVSIKKIFLKRKFLQRISKPVQAPEVSQTETQNTETQNPQKRKFLGRFKIFRKPKFLSKKTEAVQNPAPVQKRKLFRKPKFVQRTQMSVTRKRKRLVARTRQLPKQLGQSAKRRFEDSRVFRKYRLPVENSKWFKKLKPKVMKPINEQKKRKAEKQQRLDEIRKAPSEREYQESRFERLIKAANELVTPFRKLHELNAINRRLVEYIANGEKKAATPPKPGRFAKLVPAPLKKPTPEATDAREVADHFKKLRDMQRELDKNVEDVAANHAVEIAQDPNYAWVLTPPRVAQKFAIPAAKYINDIAKEKAAAVAKKNNNKPNTP